MLIIKYLNKMAYKLFLRCKLFETNIFIEDAEMPKFFDLNLVLTVFINNSKLTDSDLGKFC
jgi:hypothetical protein